MRILHIAFGKYGKPVPAIYGGAVQQTIEELSEQHTKMGHQVFVISSVKEEFIAQTRLNTRYVNSNVNYIYCVIKKITRLNLLINFIKILIETIRINNIDVVHLHTPQLVIPFKMISRFIGKPKIIWHVHNKGRFSSWGTKHYVSIVGVSENVLNQNNIMLNEKNVSVIHNIARSDLFKIIENKNSNLYNGESDVKDRFVIGFAGRISEEKGLDVMLEAVNLLDEEIKKKIIVLISGSSNFKGDAENEYTIGIKESDYEFQINWLGYIDNWELYKFYNSLDLFIVPSVWEEPAGQVIIESQLCGTQVLASNIGGIPEYLSPYEEVFETSSKLDLANKIRKIYYSNDLNQKKERRIWTMESFNLNKISQEWISLYERKGSM